MAEPSSAHYSEIDSGDKSTSEYELATVLACGYRQIRIQNPVMNFPTFLVSLPNQQTAEACFFFSWDEPPLHDRFPKLP
jgi:hypothetical protein